MKLLSLARGGSLLVTASVAPEVEGVVLVLAVDHLQCTAHVRLSVDEACELADLVAAAADAAGQASARRAPGPVASFLLSDARELVDPVSGAVNFRGRK